MAEMTEVDEGVDGKQNEYEERVGGSTANGAPGNQYPRVTRRELPCEAPEAWTIPLSVARQRAIDIL